MNQRHIGFSILGFIFIISALSKAVNVPAFAALTRDFLALAGMDVFQPYAISVAVMICAVELILGVLMLGRFRKIALICVVVMLIGFTWLTWMNLTDLYGGIESCGCFGELIHFSPLGGFVKNIVLLTVSLTMLWSSRRPAADDVAMD